MSIKSLKTIQLVLLLSLSCNTAIISALESDRTAQIHIEADEVNLDQSKGIASYKGNVIFKQGSINITADSIQVFAKNGQLDYAKINGGESLARFEQEVESGQKMIGEAKGIDVQQKSGDITFKGNAVVDDGTNKISSEFIRYNSTQHRIAANNQGKESGRVKMIFLPPTPQEQQ